MRTQCNRVLEVSHLDYQICYIIIKQRIYLEMILIKIWEQNLVLI